MKMERLISCADCLRDVWTVARNIKRCRLCAALSERSRINQSKKDRRKAERRQIQCMDCKSVVLNAPNNTKRCKECAAMAKKEYSNAHNNEWKVRNRDRVRFLNKKSRLKNLQSVRRKARNAARKDYVNNREKWIERGNTKRNSLKDCYVIGLLRASSGLKQIPPESVDAKREILLLLRAAGVYKPKTKRT